MENVKGVIKGTNIDFGSVTSNNGVTENIVVPMTECLNGKSLAIGLGLIFLGAGYLVVSSFKNGAESYLTSEFNVMYKAGIIGGNTNE